MPASKLFESEGATVEYVTVGAGKPTIVLINGSGGPIAGWHKILPLLSGATTVVAYNRPGLGRSSKPIRPQTAGAMAEDLKRLLIATGAPEPWVLVGHSFGGLVANLFARLHAGSICGVVLLDATAPEDVLLLRKHENLLQKSLAWVANRLAPLNPNHETPHALQSVTEIAGAPAFPSVPLTVITGTRPALAWATNRELLALRAQHQKSLVGLSPLGQQLLATKSGHFPQFSEPELVVSAILKVASTVAN
jgi:pimeloyl-ACP methyl ester carboxylesterase